MDGVTDADAKEPTGTDGEHGVFDVISGIGTLGAGNSVEPGVNTLHTVARSRHSANGDGDNNCKHNDVLFRRNTGDKKRA